MTRHGKNNTASSVFTYAERQMAGGGTKKQRLGALSMSAFDACRLCLSTAQEPQVDLDGHVFCRECILEDLLKQKKDMKRQQLLLNRMKAEEAAHRAEALQAARERVLKDFERSQSGVGNSRATNSAAAGTKRKLDLDSASGSASLAELTSDAETQALEQLAIEAAESRKAKLPNFWLPSLTPSAAPTKLEEVKLKTLCRAGGPAHPIMLKELEEVRWGRAGEEAGSGGKASGEYACIGCAKGLTNNVKMAVLRPCGHVFCSSCVDALVRPSCACASCDTPLDKDKKGKDKDGGVIELFREGTGYAAGGQAEATKFDLSFQ